MGAKMSFIISAFSPTASDGWEDSGDSIGGNFPLIFQSPVCYLASGRIKFTWACSAVDNFPSWPSSFFHETIGDVMTFTRNHLPPHRTKTDSNQSKSKWLYWLYQWTNDFFVKSMDQVHLTATASDNARRSNERPGKNCPIHGRRSFVSFFYFWFY